MAATTNIGPFRDVLMSSLVSKKRILIIGDSQFSPDSTPRLLEGVRDRFPFPFFGWTSQAQITVSTILPLIQQFGNTASSNAVSRTPDTASPYTGTMLFSPGSVGITPTRWAERQFTADASTGSLLWRSVFLSGSANGASPGTDRFSSFRMGSWCAANMDFRVIVFDNGGAPSCTKITVRTYRDGTQKTSTTFTPSGGPSVQSYAATANSSTASDEPWIQLFTDAITEGVYDGTAVANSSIAILGAHLEAHDATVGLSLTPISNAGWTAEAHASTTPCSDANLQGYISAVTNGAGFDLVLMMLGHNLTSNELSGSTVQAQFSTNLSSIISRYNTANTNLGHAAAPWLVICPWRNSDSGGRADTVYDQISDAMATLATTHSSGKVGHLSLAHLLPDSTTLNNMGVTTGGDFHPQSQAACDYIVDAIIAGVLGKNSRSRLRACKR